MDNQKLDSVQFQGKLRLHPFCNYIFPLDMEPGNYMHIGIIDYLQAWDNEKKAQAVAKQVKAG